MLLRGAQGSSFEIIDEQVGPHPPFLVRRNFRLIITRFASPHARKTNPLPSLPAPTERKFVVKLLKNVQFSFQPSLRREETAFSLSRRNDTLLVAKRRKGTPLFVVNTRKRAVPRKRKQVGREVVYV